MRFGYRLDTNPHSYIVLEWDDDLGRHTLADHRDKPWFLSDQDHERLVNLD